MISKKQLRVAFLGLGNVASGTLQILHQNGAFIAQRTHCDIVPVKALVRDVGKQRDLKGVSIELTMDPDSILNDPEIDVVVELMGGEQPAYDYICQALRNKKYVVTASKEIIAKHKTALFELAREQGVDIYFEASVGGGIPLIRTLKVGFAANRIQSFYGILNGTTNYILTKVAEENKAFPDVLKQAQQLGFAEADPTMDVSGLDAAYKLVILAAVAFKVDVSLEDIFYEGIDRLSVQDIQQARELGYGVRLLAIGQSDERQRYSFRVHPTLLPLSHSLMGIRNEFNALFLTGDAVGDALMSGKGAGAFPTGSAVVSDLISLSFDFPYVSERNLETHLEKPILIPFSEVVTRFFVRIVLEDQAGALSDLTTVFGRFGISLSKVLQKEGDEGLAEIALITHDTSEGNMTAVLKELESHQLVRQVVSVIRVRNK